MFVCQNYAKVSSSQNNINSKVISNIYIIIVTIAIIFNSIIQILFV